MKLTEAEKVRLGRTPTGVLEAYDLVLRGHEERKRATREGNAEARRLFVKALDLDPEYASAYAGLSWTHLQSWQFLWSTDRESLERARELAERALALNDTLVDASHLLGQIYLWTLGHAYYLTERRQEALDAFGKIEQQNPYFVPAHAYRAVVFSELGRVKEAREAWDKAGHLSPGASMPNLRERLPYKRSADLDRFLTAAHRAGTQ